MYLKSKLSILYALSLLLTASMMFSACSKRPFVDVLDVTKYSQNPIDYLSGENKKVPGEFLTNKAITDDFDGRYFVPWKLRKPPYPLSQVKWPWDSYNSQNSFKENQRRIDESWFKLMLLEANFDHYGKVSKPAIIIRTTSIRNFPSHKPVFKDFSIPGEGYPFDYSQNSITTSNEPVFISHYSTTKEWVYIITSYTSGWVSTHDVALIGTDIIDKWAQARQAIILKDDVPFYDLDHNFISNSRLGMMLPIMKVESDSYQGIIATSKSDDFVTFSIVRVPKDISISDPIAVKPQSIAVMAKSLINKPYGWGGLYEDRDCSSTLRDMFKPFSLWLPRNSKAQAQVGRVIDLSLLKPKQKEQEIIANGVPFQTLIYKPGHIMLYIGSVGGKVMVLHNMWGVTTINKKIKRRNIVGRTIISTLHVGKELKGYPKKNTFLHQITSMNVLTMKPTEQKIIIQPKKKVRKSKAKAKKSSKRKSSRQRRREAREAKKAEEEGKAKKTEQKQTNKETLLNPDALPIDKAGDKEPTKTEDTQAK